MKQLIVFFILLFSALLGACDKKKSTTFMGNPNGDEPFKFRPCSLLNSPSIGWQDSTINSVTFIKSAVVNPINKNEIIYSAKGNIYNFNKRTKQKQIIASGMFNYILQINQFGDILFCNSLQNICKVKSNGDSLKVYSQLSYSPFWDYTGKFIYYYSGVTLYKLNAATGTISNTYSGMPEPLCFSRTSDKLLTVNITLKTVYYKDVVTGIETPILSNFNKFSIPASIDNQENVFFSNDNGIYRVDAITKKLDTLYTSCTYAWVGNNLLIPDTYAYNPYVSPNSETLMFVYHHWIPLVGSKKYTNYYALEMDLATKKVYEIKGMP